MAIGNRKKMGPWDGGHLSGFSKRIKRAVFYLLGMIRDLRDLGVGFRKFEKVIAPEHISFRFDVPSRHAASIHLR